MNSLSRLYWFTRYYKLFRLAMNSPMKNDILYDTFIAASQYFHNNKNRRNEIAPNNVKYILFLLLLWSVFLSGASILVIFSLWPTSSKIIRDNTTPFVVSKTRIYKVPFFNKEVHISNIFMIPCRLYIQSHFLFSFFLEAMHFDKWNLSIK